RTSPQDSAGLAPAAFCPGGMTDLVGALRCIRGPRAASHTTTLLITFWSFDAREGASAFVHHKLPFAEATAVAKGRAAMNSKTWTRRNILKGSGVALALPFLVSLGEKPARAAAAAGVKKRYVTMYFPNGTADFWKPTGGG